MFFNNVFTEKTQCVSCVVTTVATKAFNPAMHLMLMHSKSNNICCLKTTLIPTDLSVQESNLLGFVQGGECNRGSYWLRFGSVQWGFHGNVYEFSYH